MKDDVLYLCSVFLLSFVIASSIIPSAIGQENNVCPTFRDYNNMKNNINCWYDFAADKKVPDIIKRSGYPFQEFKVQTKDGYILTVFRIPSLNMKKEPVFLLHGIQSTAGIFVALGKNSLAFQLYDAGHDVWLGNYRGTEYSEQHVSMNASQKEFWDYGADEIGLIDVPTMLNLVMYHAGQRGKIIYIGHSLGTTAALMYASEYPEHAKETVKMFIFLSPAYKLRHLMSPYRAFLPMLRDTLRLTNNLNVVQIISQANARNITKPACLASSAMMLACLNLVNLYLGPFTQIAPETVPVYFNHLPGGTSLKTFMYIAEAVKGKFTKYDYSRGRNMIKYGSTEPPEYDVTKIKIPTIIYYARHDWATPKADAIHLYKTLPNETRAGMYEVRNFNFNHLDFVFGRNAKTLVYDHILKTIDKMSKKT